MAVVRHLERLQPQSEVRHSEVQATYAFITGDGGERWLQIDTYGSSDREILGKKSQSMRFTTEAIAQLKDLLSRHF